MLVYWRVYVIHPPLIFLLCQIVSTFPLYMIIKACLFHLRDHQLQKGKPLKFCHLFCLNKSIIWSHFWSDGLHYTHSLLMLYWYAVMLFLYKKYKHALLGRIPLFLETGRRPRNIIVNLNVTVIASKRDIASPMVSLN